MVYQLINAPSKTRPLTQGARIPPLVVLFQQLSSNFSFTTLLLVGACVQSLLVLLIPAARRSYVMLPAFLLLGTKVIDAILIHFRVRPNPYLEGIHRGRNTALIPNEDGVFDEEVPSAEKVAVLLLGAKSNHPFGILAPEFMEMGGWLGKMNAQFDSDEVPTGFLGQTNWERKDERGGREFCFLSYWRSIEDLHAFAHSPLHREAWRWWEKTLKEHDMLGINHEIYEAPARGWENVYVNFQPTGLGATRYARKNEDGEEWISPLVDARKGKLAKSGVRLGRGEIKYDHDRPFGEKYA